MLIAVGDIVVIDVVFIGSYNRNWEILNVLSVLNDIIGMLS